ncbi:YgjP-like metallopeptidase domain-containing protein [Methanohalophilus sp.]
MQLHIKDAVIDYEIIHRSVKYGRLEFRDGMLRVIVPKGYGNTAAFIEKNTDWIYDKHLHLQRVIALAREKRLEKKRADPYFYSFVETIVQRLQRELEVEVRDLNFRKMKRKWASCSSHKKLVFNRHMMYLPDSLIEYIVYHELLHLIEFKHNKRFWGLVENKYPQRKEYDLELAAYWHLIKKTFY